MKIYVIGPVSGKPNRNRDEFERARKLLEKRGYEAEIPHDSIPADTGWLAAVQMSMRRLKTADGVAKLNGWRKSTGARIEADLARDIGKPCKFLGRWR